VKSTEITKAANKHVKITSISIRIYSNLKFTYLIEYDRRPHNNRQTDLNVQEVTNCNQMHYVEYTTTSHACYTRFGFLIHRYS